MTSDKRQPFVLDGLPESQNVEDRRAPGYRHPSPPTMVQMTEDAERERRERDMTLHESELAKSLGAHQVASGRYGVVGLVASLFAMLGKGRG